MVDIIYPVTLGMILLYFVLLFVNKFWKKLTGNSICALCSTVSITWISLLVLTLFGYSINPVLIAILMGGSIVGIAYTLEKKSKKFTIWKPLIVFVGIIAVYFLLKVI